MRLLIYVAYTDDHRSEPFVDAVIKTLSEEFNDQHQGSDVRVGVYQYMGWIAKSLQTEGGDKEMRVKSMRNVKARSKAVSPAFLLCRHQ